MLNPLVVRNIILTLGIINFVSGLAIMITCRCLPTSKWGKGLMNYRPYKAFYKFHCFIWWVFWPSVMAHALLAIVTFGWPRF